MSVDTCRLDETITREAIPQPPVPRRKMLLRDVKATVIVDVWQENFEKELNNIIQLIDEFKVIALDTEFPGIQQLPFKVINEHDFEFKMIRESVRNSKIIQIGLSIANEEGEVPMDHPFSWQFNFIFDENLDQINEESLELLRNAGIDFKELKKRGIRRDQFADLVAESDLILNEEVRWIVFHGGFDFAYLLQMLYGSAIPDSPILFYNLLNCFFPRIYDVKFLIQDIDHLRESGLNKIASSLRIDRIGPKHQAGSDSLVTLGVFLKLAQGDLIEVSAIERGLNTIYGIGHGFVKSHVRDYLFLYKQKYLQQYDTQQQTTENSQAVSTIYDPSTLAMNEYFDKVLKKVSHHYSQNHQQLAASIKTHGGMPFYPPLLAAMQQQQQQSHNSLHTQHHHPNQKNKKHHHPKV